MHVTGGELVKTTKSGCPFPCPCPCHLESGRAAVEHPTSSCCMEKIPPTVHFRVP
ncbi:hypothetical protein JB92DRAFT_2966620 [Gautieria morchelliformis]|nr:hypothetical protein JB92DRAFT_2966620 [Gautieria morchelliformis]